MNPIKILRMRSGAGAIPALSAASYSDIQTSPTDSVCSITFANTGQLSQFTTGGGSANVLAQWLTSLDAVAAALYELEAVITVGTAFNAAGTTAAGSGTWRDLASNWTYGNTVTDNVNLAKETTSTFTIRRKSDLVTMASASITITAEVTL